MAPDANLRRAITRGAGRIGQWKSLHRGAEIPQDIRQKIAVDSGTPVINANVNADLILDQSKAQSLRCARAIPGPGWGANFQGPA